MSAAGSSMTAVSAATAGPIRSIALAGLDADRRAACLTREWLVTNGLGGYASGTIGGAPSRRYHGLLIAALPPPYGRRLLLTDVSEELYVDGQRAGQLTARTVEDAAHVPLTRIQAGVGAAGVALRLRRRRNREALADAARPEHRARALRARRRRRLRSPRRHVGRASSLARRARRRTPRRASAARAHGVRLRALRSARCRDSGC